MAEIPKPDYAQIVKDAGVPLDKDSWKQVLKAEMAAEEAIINNDSPFSPFWRLIENAVTSCTVWLVDRLMVKHVLPNVFLATATGEWLDQQAWACQTERKGASKATGHVAFQRAAAQGPALMIAAGTWIQTDVINGHIYRVRVTEDTELPENQTLVLAPVEAELPGAAYNLGEGYYHILPTAIPGIAAATNAADWLDSAGADEESHDELRLRVRDQWSAIAKWHIDAAYRALLTKRAGIQDDNVYFEHNAPRGPGTANAYILLDTGEPSAAMIADMNQHIRDNGQHGHGDDLLVMAMPGVETNIQVSVWPVVSMTLEARDDLKAQIEHFIRAAFRENTDYQPTRTNPVKRFSFSKLGQELHAQFPGVESLEFAQADILNNLTIPRIGTLEVTLENA
ncbi:baseplate J/gp47 family protein [Photobacterium sp. CAU 1568]|uniref:Baseplate J/gp47 family protein n=1 Tax=Photobacterium arenosum TaxID=2774143 RepID=A0ABR9BRH9_9GAMM|nr:baseplate J/gp47 family protein [Photobacterium arenosum]MBD8515163.1 baseplate J/gp47 family protein [Photobacterium arenosum]